MFFEQISEIVEIAKKTGTAVFVVPKDTPVKIRLFCSREKKV